MDDLTILALQAGKGDREALSRLVDSVYDYVRKVVRAKIPQSEYEDFENDIWLSLMRSLPQYEGKARFNTWLNQVLKWRIADYYRKRHREIVNEQNAAVYRNNELTYNLETDLIIDDILDRCPESYRETLRLHLCNGMMFKEIAEKEHIHCEAAWSKYRRGIAWLRSRSSYLGLSQ